MAKAFATQFWNHLRDKEIDWPKRVHDLKSKKYADNPDMKVNQIYDVLCDVLMCKYAHGCTFLASVVLTQLF
jgi:hypothetical protein